MKTLILKAISIYHDATRVFRPKSPCKFYPTCSHYAEECIKKYGVLKGGWLSFKRILKCHPWREHSVDNVP